MYKRAWEEILDARYVLIVSHIFPDGDTIGSSLALYNSLKQRGKKVALFNASYDELPKEYSFLNGFSKIHKKLPKFFDLLVCCDCANFERLGVSKGDYRIINIDHHKTNTNFGNLNLVLEDASSSAEVVYKLFETNSILMSPEVATALYTSIADDTEFFKHGYIGVNTFKIATKLLEYGANAMSVAEKIRNVSLAKIRLKAYMYNNFELHFDGTVASIVFTKKSLVASGAKRSDTKNIVNKLLEIVNVKVALMVLEIDGGYKISLRTKGVINLSGISTFYGGGGHKSATGFELKGDNGLKIRDEILNRINNYDK